MLSPNQKYFFIEDKQHRNLFEPNDIKVLVMLQN